MANRKNSDVYLAWQNRALDFYLGARVCYEKKIYLTSTFLSQQAVEQLMKATLIWWDSTFAPEEHGHALKKMSRIISNKVPNQSNFTIPNYLYDEQRYQSLSRYPASRKPIYVPANLIPDLDLLFADLIEMVSPQFGSQLYHTLTGKHWSRLLVLRRGNIQMRRLRKHTEAKLKSGRSSRR